VVNVDLAYALFMSLSVGGSSKYFKYKEQVENILSIIKDRQEVLLKVIELAGSPNTPKQRRIIAEAYAWSRSQYRKEAIKYIELYLNSELYYEYIPGAHITSDYREATKQDVENAHKVEMLMYLGKAYEGEYDFDKALECFTKQAEIIPYWASIYCNIAKILTKQNKLNEAVQVLEKAKIIERMDETNIKVLDSRIYELKQKIKKGYVYKPRKKCDL